MTQAPPFTCGVISTAARVSESSGSKRYSMAAQGAAECSICACRGMQQLWHGAVQPTGVTAAPAAGGRPAGRGRRQANAAASKTQMQNRT